ncbi:hypothetical protein D3C76_1098690 [compost metagenome]
MELIAGIGDAVTAGPADGGQLFIAQWLRDQRVVVDRDHARGQMAEQRWSDVGGEGDLPGDDFAVGRAQAQAVVARIQLQHRAVFEQLNALFKAYAAQFGSHFRWIEQGVVGFEQTCHVGRGVEFLCQLRAFQPLAVNAEPRVVALHGAQSVDLPGLAGDVEFALAFELDLHAEAIQIGSQLIEVLPAQADQLLRFIRPTLEGVGHAMGNAWRAESAIAPAGLTATTTGLDDRDAQLGVALACQ